jgi:tetratricopeptide (TPR) repeat protein
MSPDKKPPAEPVIEPQSAEDYMHRAWTLHVQGDYTASEADFRKALSMNPELVEAHYGLGMSYKIRQQSEPAIEEFEKTIQLLENHPIPDDPARTSMLQHLSESHIALLKKGFDEEPAP